MAKGNQTAALRFQKVARYQTFPGVGQCQQRVKRKEGVGQCQQRVKQKGGVGLCQQRVKRMHANLATDLNKAHLTQPF